MPTKKRKYEARFPPARIKKIMQTDEDIGKVAAAVPVIISRALEIFLQSLVEKTSQHTQGRRAKTMTTAHLKHCIESETQFDFLKDLVVNVADVANQEEEDSKEAMEHKQRKPRKPRVNTERKKKPKKEEKSSSEESNDEYSSSEKEKDSPISDANNKSYEQKDMNKANEASSNIQVATGNQSGPSSSPFIPAQRPQVPAMFAASFDDDEDYDS